MGANLGRPLAALRGAVAEIGSLGRVEARSRIYATAPVGGPPGQPDYRNAVILVRPAPAATDPKAFLAALLEIEAHFGRERRERWAARTLDLDLLALDDVVRNDPGLILPHPRMMERAFVLVPLLDVAPEWRHPLTGRSVREALAALPRADVTPVGDGWDAR